jgi:hypothetical protein
VRIAIFLLLSLSSAEARRGVTPKILGWTADGLKLAYVAPPEAVGEGEMGGTGTVTYGVLVDGRSGITESYFVDSEGDIPPDDQKRNQGLPQKKDWQALAASLKPCEKGDAHVIVQGKGVRGAWKKGAFEFAYGGDEMAQEKAAFFTMSPKGKSVSTTWGSLSPNAAMGAGFSGRIKSCFAPGGKRVAWIVERDSGMMRDPGDYAVLIGPNGGPRIQLVADKSILAAAAQKVGAALEAAGIIATASKASNEKKPRPTSVIYAATGFEAEAQKLAQAMPGGATVAKLDWKAPFEIVVGIGATAMK